MALPFLPLCTVGVKPNAPDTRGSQRLLKVFKHDGHSYYIVLDYADMLVVVYEDPKRKSVLVAFDVNPGTPGPS